MKATNWEGAMASRDFKALQELYEHEREQKRARDAMFWAKDPTLESYVREAVHKLVLKRSRTAKRMGITVTKMEAERRPTTNTLVVKAEIEITMEELAQTMGRDRVPDLIVGKLRHAIGEEISKTVRRLMGVSGR